MTTANNYHFGLTLMMFLLWYIVEAGGDSNACTLDGGKIGFLCTSGVCVDSLFRCDGSAQCYDSSDEKNCCDATAPLRGKYFLCHSGKCISARLRCDEEIDCNTDLRKDDSDEEGCLHLSTVEISLIIMFIVFLLTLLVYKAILKRRPRCFKKPPQLPLPPDFLTSARNTTVHHESSVINDIDDPPSTVSRTTTYTSALPILDSIQISAPPSYHIAVSRGYTRANNVLSVATLAADSPFTGSGPTTHLITTKGTESPPPSYEEVQKASSQFKMLKTEGIAICTTSTLQISPYTYENHSNLHDESGISGNHCSLPIPD